MKAVQVAEFKSDFSNILKKVQQKNESFVIEYGRNHQKIAILIPYDHAFEATKSQRKFGLICGSGSFEMRDFEMGEEEFLGL